MKTKIQKNRIQRNGSEHAWQITLYIKKNVHFLMNHKKYILNTSTTIFYKPCTIT